MWLGSTLDNLYENKFFLAIFTIAVIFTMPLIAVLAVPIVIAWSILYVFYKLMSISYIRAAVYLLLILMIPDFLWVLYHIVGWKHLLISISILLLTSSHIFLCYKAGKGFNDLLDSSFLNTDFDMKEIKV